MHTVKVASAVCVSMSAGWPVDPTAPESLMVTLSSTAVDAYLRAQPQTPTSEWPCSPPEAGNTTVQRWGWEYVRQEDASDGVVDGASAHDHRRGAGDHVAHQIRLQLRAGWFHGRKCGAVRQRSFAIVRQRTILQQQPAGSPIQRDRTAWSHHKAKVQRLPARVLVVGTSTYPKWPCCQ